MGWDPPLTISTSGPPGIVVQRRWCAMRNPNSNKTYRAVVRDSHDVVLLKRCAVHSGFQTWQVYRSDSDNRGREHLQSAFWSTDTVCKGFQGRA